MDSSALATMQLQLESFGKVIYTVASFNVAAANEGVVKRAHNNLGNVSEL